MSATYGQLVLLTGASGSGKTYTRTEMLCSAIRKALGKVARYVSMHEIDHEDVIPLVFETYGGYAPATFEFLQRISLIIARNDSDKAWFSLNKDANVIEKQINDRMNFFLTRGISELKTTTFVKIIANRLPFQQS